MKTFPTRSISAQPSAFSRNVFFGVFALCTAVFCLSQNLGAEPAVSTASDAIEGAVKTGVDGDRVWIDLRSGSRHHFGTTLPRRAVRELPGKGLEIRRQAGTVRIDAPLGERGRFKFVADPEYRQALTDRGLLSGTTSVEQLFELAMIDVTLDFIDDLAALGYREDLRRLVEMRIHEVSATYVRELQGVGLSGLPSQRLVEMRIHGVEADDVAEWRRLGLGELPPQRLVEMAIHGVTPDYVSSLRELGVDGLTAGRLVEMRIHGVDASFVRDMIGLGYDNVPVHRWAEMRIHGVDGDFVRKLAKRGETGLSVGQLIERRIHGG
ncbi:MAG: hypothetical protein MPN21_16670 [Thermoanaerobaculia bacterium]|nr:hypothetical protein [Thermoanaerobaculia bacterium]